MGCSSPACSDAVESIVGRSASMGALIFACVKSSEVRLTFLNPCLVVLLPCICVCLSACPSAPVPAHTGDASSLSQENRALKAQLERLLAERDDLRGKVGAWVLEWSAALDGGPFIRAHTADDAALCPAGAGVATWHHPCEGALLHTVHMSIRDMAHANTRQQLASCQQQHVSCQ